MRGAVEAEIIRCNARLRWVGDGTGRFNWHDLWVTVAFAPPGSVVRAALQATTPSAVTGQTAPRPQRPSQPAGDPFKDDESGVFRGEAIPIDELNKWLGWT